MVDTWNRLLNSVINADTVYSFKKYNLKLPVRGSGHPNRIRNFIGFDPIRKRLRTNCCRIRTLVADPAGEMLGGALEFDKWIDGWRGPCGLVESISCPLVVVPRSHL